MSVLINCNNIADTLQDKIFGFYELTLKQYQKYLMVCVNLTKNTNSKSKYEISNNLNIKILQILSSNQIKRFKHQEFKWKYNYFCFARMVACQPNILHTHPVSLCYLCQRNMQHHFSLSYCLESNLMIMLFFPDNSKRYYLWYELITFFYTRASKLWGVDSFFLLEEIQLIA